MGEVRVEERGRVLLATLDNPPHGLMDVGTVAGLEAVVARAESEPGVGAVVLTGAHPERFVAHYDVRELLEAARAGPAVSRAPRRRRCAPSACCAARARPSRPSPARRRRA